jgi:hypothetical protein
MSAGRDPAAVAAHVRFAPKATELVHHAELTLSANRVPTHSSKKTPLFDHLVGEGE